MLLGEPTAAKAIQSSDPPKPLAKVTVTGLAPTTVVTFGVSVGGGSIVNVSSEDVPPPGAGVTTFTWAVPVAARSDAEIVAMRLVVLVTFVGLAVPFQ